MKTRTSVVRGLLFLAALLVCFTASSRNLVNLTHAPATVPDIIAGDSLAADAYRRAMDEYGSGSRQADKGFFPRLGNYFDPDAPGWGLDIQAIGNTVFAVWFTYLANGDPFWYIIVGDLETKGTEGTVTGNIEQFTWDPFGTPGAQATATVVGTMTIEWTNPRNANVSWTLDGVDNSASVRFIEFSTDPTLSDMTGHYFPFFAPGWGFTLLTQGPVTVMTMYWYKNGQPVWAQGVADGWGRNTIVPLLYFNGPGLCPACLSSKGDGPTTTPLEDLNLQYGVDVPPIANIFRTTMFGKGGPLGSDPFSDIPLSFSPIAAEAITSAFGDNFDPNYNWFVAGKGSNNVVYRYDRARTTSVSETPQFPLFYFVTPPITDPPPFSSVLADPESGWLFRIPYPTTKGGGCVPFEYDNGNIGTPSVVSGVVDTAYLGLPTAERTPGTPGLLPVFQDSNCNTPFLRAGAGGNDPSYILMGPAGDGHMMTWRTPFLFLNEKQDKDDDDKGADGD